MPFDAALLDSIEIAKPASVARQSLAQMRLDDIVLAKLKRLDRHTQAHVFKQFEKPLYTFCFRVLGHSADALDALQECFVQAFTRVAQFRGESPFGAWLRAIALRICLKLIETRKLWPQLQPLEDSSTDAEMFYCTIEHQLDLELALAKLNPQHRAVLWLFCVERYSHQEIADAFQMSLSFSKSCVARALKSLRELLQINETSP